MSQGRSVRHSLWKALGVLVCFLGLVLAAGGGYLIALSGSPYYLTAGILLCVTGFLLFRQRTAALFTYSALFCGTILWTLYETGDSLWGLMPRILMPMVLALVLFALSRWFAANAADDTNGRLARVSLLAPSAICLLLLLFAAVRDLNPHTAPYSKAATGPYDTSGTVDLSDSPPPSEWPSYGRTEQGQRFSPLDQITKDNVKNLQVAWTAHTGAVPTSAEVSAGKKGKQEFNFEATALKVGNHLVLCTPHAEIISMEPETGRQQWKFAPQAELGSDSFLACRGVSYYAASNAIGLCSKRILSATLTAKMYAVDLETGTRCPDFGKNGEIDLTEGMGLTDPGVYFVSSPPSIVHGKAVVGGWIWDNHAVGEPSGVVRAFDAVTGKLAWAFDVGRLDRTTLPPPGETYTRETPNVWTVISSDEKLGLVFLPTGNQTPDFWGHARLPASEKFASSLIAVDADSGKLRWSFQTAHHDIWDFDMPSQAVSVDLPAKSGPGSTPALLVPTKQGQLFILDRRTGQSLTKVEEKPVPQGAVEGDYTAATQPFPDTPSVAPPDLKETDMWGISPVDQLFCRVAYRSFRYEGMYTPPSVKGTISYPGSLGIYEWGSVSVDPRTNRMISNTNWMPTVVKLIPRDKWDEKKIYGFGGPGTGSPYGVTVLPFLSPLFMPCHAPPWGFLTAMDLNTRKIAWRRPIGTGRANGPLGIPTLLPILAGTPNMGGSVQTKSGVVFMGATADQTMHAYDAATGDELWHDYLPHSGIATPTIYTGKDGKEYVVIAAGGHGGFDKHQGDEVVAYTLK